MCFILIIDGFGYLCSICDGNIKWKKPALKEHKQSLHRTEFVFLLLPQTPSAQFETCYETERHSCMMFYVAMHFQASEVYGSQKKVLKRLSLSVRTCTLGVFKLQYKSGKDKALQHFYTWECCLLRINIVIYTAALQTFDFIVLAPRAVWIRYTGMSLRCDQILYIFPPKLLI